MSDETTPSIPDAPDWYDKLFDPYCLMIGRISTLWAGFENDIDQLIAELSNVEAAVGACLTGQMIGPGPRFRALIALIRFRGLEKVELAKWNALAVEAGVLGSKRNRYIHDAIVVGTNTGIVSSAEITADKRLKFDFVAFDLVKAHQLWLEIKEAQNSLHRLRSNLVNMITWSTTQFEQSTYGIRRHWTPEDEITPPA